MERQFTEEIRALKLGDGETFHGEGILAVTKALLQSGVSYVGGYQGAPVSHLLDVMVQAKDYLDDLDQRAAHDAGTRQVRQRVGGDVGAAAPSIAAADASLVQASTCTPRSSR